MKIRSDYQQQFDVLTFVPVSPKRARKRGYDQAELLANAVGEELGIPNKRMLIKVLNNPPQSGTAAAERKANVLGAYRMVPGQDLGGQRVLLIDDILTTGSTADECARMLITAGAKEVHCGVVATPRKKKICR